MFCCTRSQRKKTGKKLGSLRKHDSGPMFARLEEFDVLTPMQSTPATSLAPNFYRNYGSRSASSSTSSDSRLQLIPPLLTSSSSDSPPPPRRPNNGKTLIVPLNASRYRTPLAMTTVAGTPDSRLISFECGTTKSCATIPEDDEDETDDLLSIDRTSLSIYEQASGQFVFSAYNLNLPQSIPEFQSSSSGFSPMLPAPTYSPPSLPSDSPLTRLDESEIDRIQNDERGIHHSNSNSPNSSSSASISDSYFLNNFDNVSSAANSQIFESSLCEESDIISKFHLHRIEEESEDVEDKSAVGVCSSQNYDVLSNSISAAAQFFPRSISQQFDMLRQQ